MFSTSLTGLIVSALISVAQLLGRVPLIQQSETYERRRMLPRLSRLRMSKPAPPMIAIKLITMPRMGTQDGLQRNAFTVWANIFTAIGFALLLMGVSAIHGRP
ncbi:MAG TPA: hypothetical protein VE267_10995 [Bradyrhizobium sp.]|nr:hypothetical protein [Bradyrhizobium sp.]